MIGRDDDDPEPDIPFVGDMVSQSSNTIALLHQWRDLRIRASMAMTKGSSTAAFVGEALRLADADIEAKLTAQVIAPEAAHLRLGTLTPTVTIEPLLPELAVGVGLVVEGLTTHEGQLITAVTPAYRHILNSLDADPTALQRLTPRGLEELVAGAYRERGARVTLTPHSGDGGVDIIVEHDDPEIMGALRLLVQVKRYAPRHLVPAKDLREFWGVITHDFRATKGIFTTTSDFAPGIATEFADRVPERIELIAGERLNTWLKRIHSKS